MTAPSRRVLQMRLIVEADDYEDAVRFYPRRPRRRRELQLHGTAVSGLVDGARARLTMRAVDRIYETAALARRGTSASTASD